MPDAGSWMADHGDELLGRPVAGAVALVSGAGLHARTAAPGAPRTLEFRSDRITLSVGEDGTVVGASAG